MMGDMDDEMNEMPGLSAEQEAEFAMAAELNASSMDQLLSLDEESLKVVAEQVEQMFSERFGAPLSDGNVDDGLEVTSMFLPQMLMDVILPHIHGVLLSEDNLDVVPGSDLPLMCRVDGYISVD